LSYFVKYRILNSRRYYSDTLENDIRAFCCGPNHAIINAAGHKNDGLSLSLRLDCAGKHNVGPGSSQQTVMESLIVEPLKRLNMKISDSETYSSDLHNPEITLPAGSGNTAASNYKIMAALDILNKEIQKTNKTRL
jgi:hypothetical protein